MFDVAPALTCGDRTLKLDRPAVMGIVNVTPDSFSDGGDFVAAEHAIEHGIQLIAQGATILDIGGESTRPGADIVSVEEELARVMPVLTALRSYVDQSAPQVILSIDTYKPEVMRAAAQAGAGMINDVRALLEPGALDAAAATNCAVVMMHHKGEFKTMQEDPYYDDVTAEVHRFLTERVFAAELAGIDRHRLVIDPGFGFGKNTQHNMELLARMERLQSIKVSVLAGLSRKRTLGEITGRTEAKERIHASVAAHLIAVRKGARIVRVHDVAATVDALAVLAAVEPLQVMDRTADSRPTLEWPDD